MTIVYCKLTFVNIVRRWKIIFISNVNYNHKSTSQLRVLTFSRQNCQKIPTCGINALSLVSRSRLFEEKHNLPFDP